MTENDTFAFDPEGNAASALGFSAVGVHAGFRADPERLDMALVVADEPCAAAATFTTNVFCAAPVRVSREHLNEGGAGSPAYGCARARIPKQCAEIERAMAAIRTIEGSRRNSAAALSGDAEATCISPLSADAADAALAFDPDAAANEFGRMLGRLFACNQGFWAETMEELGRGLGRFIYLMDAAVDFNDDAASGSYNPFVTLGSDAEAMRATLALAAADAAAPYERLPLVQDANLMDAILYSGVWAQFNKAYPPQDALAQNGGSPQSEPPN